MPNSLSSFEKRAMLASEKQRELDYKFGVFIEKNPLKGGHEINGVVTMGRFRGPTGNPKYRIKKRRL
jgi:hypothetical protein